MRLANAAVVIASVALASILPAQPPSLLTASSASLLTPTSATELLRSALLIGSFENTKDIGQNARQASSFAKLLFGALGSERSAPAGIETLALPTPLEGPDTAQDNVDGRFRRLLMSSAQQVLAHAPYTAVAVGNVEVRLAYRAGTIERSSLEETQDAELSDPLIAKLVEIFSWDVDFALDIDEGDSFVAIYEERYWFGRKISEGPVVAAEFLSRGRVYRAIGFRDREGRLDYFTPQGKSLRRPFLRSPVQFSSISSRFSNARYHPILKTWRAHNGVDYSAPEGTPIRATAGGRVLSIGWNGGYGNTVVIRHDQTYSTLYAHLSQYRRNLRAGDYVEQGDVIGYVGQTGLATGPHLHYEFQVRGEHRNPLTFKFPDGQPINAALRDEFARSARLWNARLDAASGRHLAAR
jgi:murein DD-endopeptidase MepM/ murein hydrolase activator NlpD